MNDQKHLLSTPEAAQFVGLKPGTLEVWRCQGNGPRYLKVGRLVKYRQTDLEAWLEGCSRAHTSEVA